MDWYEELLTQMSVSVAATDDEVVLDDAGDYLSRDTTNGSTNHSTGNCGSNACQSFVPKDN